MFPLSLLTQQRTKSLFHVLSKGVAMVIKIELYPPRVFGN